MKRLGSVRVMRGTHDLVRDAPDYLKMIAWGYERDNEISPDLLIGMATHKYTPLPTPNFRVNSRAALMAFWLGASGS